MTALSPTSPTSASAGGRKRNRAPSPLVIDASEAEIQSIPPATTPAGDLEASHDDLPISPRGAAGHASSASNFRNVSACNRCRLRKNRCDQRLPACAACEKAHVVCVGFDPITKKEIPRSYVFYLENRVAYLESLLNNNDIKYAPAENFTQTAVASTTGKQMPSGNVNKQGPTNGAPLASRGVSNNELPEEEKLNNLVSHASMVAVQGTSDSRYLGSTAGISFARVVFAAVKSSLSGAPSERGGVRPSKPLTAGTTGTTMRDSFFGLDKKPTFKPAPFPGKELGLDLVNLYFENANPQIPTLHRPEFMTMFEKVYASEKRTARELYMLNIVFAIGAGIIVGKEPQRSTTTSPTQDTPAAKKRKLAENQRQPEEYHASAMEHLGEFLSASSAVDRPFDFSGALEELQAVLLLAGFALLRPVAPGLWYIIGVAVRLAIDLGLHQEDPIEADVADSEELTEKRGHADRKASSASIRQGNTKGRRQYIRDFRRRLWWCVYSFDRLVSTCVGRPFGITDLAVTTDFPSPLDDTYITPAGIPAVSSANSRPSYKLVAYHYFRLRLLQSEILHVLQYRQTQMAREKGANQSNPYMHKQLHSPYLQDFGGSFQRWRIDVDRRLWEWNESAPTKQDTGVQFSPLLLELNYWQAVIMLYRQSLTVPTPLAEDLKTTHDEAQSPSMIEREECEDEDQIFLKVAEAGQKVLKLYRQLHRLYLVNYTFLATHHLFMAGISFLYAIWHSPLVRSHLTMDDVDFTVLAATSVLDDLIEKCAPAEACRDAFVRMSKATIKMCISTTGFGEQAANYINKHQQDRPTFRAPITNLAEQVGSSIDPNLQSSMMDAVGGSADSRQAGGGRPPVRFDMNLQDLFSEEQTTIRQNVPPATSIWLQPSVSATTASQQQLPYSQPMHRPGGGPAASGTQFAHRRPAHTRSSSASTSAHPYNSPTPQQQPQTPYGVTDQGQQQVNYTSTQLSAQYPGLSPFSDLDFLDTFPLGMPDPAAAVAQGAMGTAVNLDGWDLGNGGGWDGSLPAGVPGASGWYTSSGEEAFNPNAGNIAGGGVDLFEGFFFGSAGGSV